MEMVATSKMRKTQDRMAASRPYSETIRNVISHVSKASVGYKHPFLVEREVKKIGILVISTDRGMCGGLNVNLFKTTLNQIKNWKEQNISTDLGLIGSKGISFFRSFGFNIKGQLSGLGDTPSLEELIGEQIQCLMLIVMVKLMQFILHTTSLLIRCRKSLLYNN